MTSLLWLALATFVVVQSNVRLRRNSETWAEMEKLENREVRSTYGKDLDPWLTDEQKETLKPIMHDSAQFKEKVMEFWKDLSTEEQNKWTAKYRTKCTSWIGESKSADAEKELLELYKTDAEAARTKYGEYLDELPEEHREKAIVWKDECHKLLTTARSRRHLDPKLDDFTKWMTEDQKKEIVEMKHSGKPLEDLRAKSMEYFKALPADKQKDLKEELKGKCKAYFAKIGTAEEMTEVKTLYDSGKKAEIPAKISAIIDRQPEDEKATATKMQTICTEVYSDTTKRRRDLHTKIEKHLSWLSDNQKEEIRQMHEDGKSKEEIRKTLLTWINDLNDDSKKAAKENTRKECYKWLEKAATKDEIAELHKLHETDHGACKTKVREYIKRLSAEEQTAVESNLPFCEKIWYGDHSHHNHGHGSHVHHGRRRRAERIPDEVFAKYFSWLTEAQKAELEMIKETGDRDAFYKKIMEFFAAATGETKTKATEELKAGCKHYAKHFFGEEKVAEIKKMKESGSPVEEISNKLKSFADELTDEDKKTRATKLVEGCKHVFMTKSSRKRRNHHEHKLEDMFKNYLSWTTDEQKEELKELAGDKDATLKKVLEFFEATSGDKKKEAVEGLRGACKHYGMDILGEDNIAALKALRESGASVEAMKKKTLEMVEGLSDDTKKEKANKLITTCEKVYAAASRRRRNSEHMIDDVISKYMSWMTQEQKDAVRALYKSDKKAEIYTKVMEYYEATTGDARKAAAQELVGACKHFGRDLLGDENADKLKEMKESGASLADIKAKVDEMVAGLTDETKKAKATRLTAGCEKIYAAASRRRRDSDHKIEDLISKYMSWMTQEQKDAIKDLYNNDKKEEIYTKVMEYYEATSDDARKTAAQDLVGACKHFGRHLLGDENADKLKEMKEAGVSLDEIKAKAKEMVAGLTDETKKAKATKLAAGCEKIYAAASRKRRDQEHNIDDVISKYFSWMNTDQKEIITDLHKSGKKEEIYTKAMQFFEATTGDTRKTAAQELMGACKHFGRHLLGDENADKIKALRESGASLDAIKTKVDEMVASLADETTKAKATKLATGCAKIYSSTVSRRRRDHHHHKLDDAFTKYLTWTTQEQKDALKALEAAGDKEGIYNKVMEYFEATSGDTRKTATEELKSGCKHFGKEIFGEEKTAALKSLKESGASADELKNKALGFIEEIEDAQKKAKASKVVAGCAKIFAVSASRRRRDHHHHKLDDAFPKYLTWTTQEQKDALKALEAAGDREGIFKTILEYFEATTGETRTKATQELQGACKHIGTDIFGEEKAKQIKELKDSGATGEEMKKKILELAEEITDESKKARAKKLVAGCEKVYYAASVPVSRRRRDKDHKLDDAFSKWLTWTTQEQKDALKALETAGNKEEIYKKVMEYFEATSGDTRKTAAEELKGACKHFGADIFGEDKMASLKALREGGATHEEMKTKAMELINGLDDAEKKAKATRLVAGCEKVFATASRRRRDQNHRIDDIISKYLSWMTQEQKDTVKDLYNNEKRPEIYTKILEYYEATSGETRKTASDELLGACKHFGRDLLGDANADTIKALRESGASIDEIRTKAQEMIGGLTDEVKKTKALKLVAGCEKVYAGASRMRRELTLETAAGKYLSWTTEEQMKELKELKAKGDKKALYNKILEFFDAAKSDARVLAEGELKNACKAYIMETFERKKVDEMARLSDKGGSKEEIAAIMSELVEGLPEDKRDNARDVIGGCKKIWNAAEARIKRRIARIRREKELEHANEGFFDLF